MWPSACVTPLTIGPKCMTEYESMGKIISNHGVRSNPESNPDSNPIIGTCKTKNFGCKMSF